ncbi:AAA family ATPase [Brevibacterium yomogidense]|uniref:AAA family ATPase n=1 Tax=Brevibacterium yomogidense TaxID=946573 RepID=UPI0018DF2361|nr:AAA family ATPase [Brevibacterium yomogidense]
MSLMTEYGAYNGTWLMAQDFPPTEYVVDGLIPEGLTYIIAAPKIGKSWMVLDLAIAVSQGTPFLGAIPVKTRPTLYLALEDGPRRIQRRAQGLDCYTLPDNIVFVHRVKSEDATALMTEFADYYAGQRPLIILDTLGKIKPQKAPGAGAYEHDYAVSASLKDVADRADGSVVVVHHNRKAGSDDFLEDVSGTQGIAGAADTIIVIRRSRNSRDAELHVTSRDASEGAYAARFDDGKWTLTGADLTQAAQAYGQQQEQKGLGDDSAEVLAFAAERPEGVRAADVATRMGWEQNKARTYLSRLNDSGKLSKSGRGLYTCVATVATVASEDSEGMEV